MLAKFFYICKSSYSRRTAAAADLLADAHPAASEDIRKRYTPPHVPIIILGQNCCHASAAAKYSNPALMMQQQLLGEQESPTYPTPPSNSAITVYNLRGIHGSMRHSAAPPPWCAVGVPKSSPPGQQLGRVAASFSVLIQYSLEEVLSLENRPICGPGGLDVGASVCIGVWTKKENFKWPQWRIKC